MTAAAFGRVSAQGTLSNSSGLVSVVRRSRGTYRVTLTQPFSSPDYQVVPLVEDTGRNIPPYAEIDQRTLSTFDIQWRNSGNVLNDYDFTLTVYSSDIVKGDRGEPGRDGVAGRDGRDGSDATVTSANIVRAVQGTPTDNQIIQYDSANSRLEFQDPPSGGGGGTAPTISNIISAIGGSPTDEQVLTYESTGPTLQWQDIPTPPPAITPVPYVTGDPHYWVANGEARTLTLIIHDVDITDTNRNTNQLLITIEGIPFTVVWPIATAPRRINIELNATQATNINDNASGTVPISVVLRQGTTSLQFIQIVNLPVITPGKAIALKEDITSAGGGTTVVANPTTDSSDPAISSITIGTTDYRISGRRGARGPAGDDASVTVANILSAIGGSPTDEQVLTYESTGNTLEWQNAPSGGGGTTVAANPSVDSSDPQLNSITIGSSDYRVVGQKGDAGAAGRDGRDGSDASVTSANMISAIGGSPTDDQILAYEATGPTLKWVDAPSGGSGTSSTQRGGFLGTEFADEKIPTTIGRVRGLASTDTRIAAISDSNNVLGFFDLYGNEKQLERILLSGFWTGIAITETKIYCVDNTVNRGRLKVFSRSSGLEQGDESRSIGDFDALGLAVTSDRYILLDDTSNLLRFYTFDGTEQNSEQVSLGSGDWEGLDLTDDRYVVLDNVAGSKAIRLFNRTSKSEETSERVDLPNRNWQAITVINGRYLVSDYDDTNGRNEIRSFAWETFSRNKAIVEDFESREVRLSTSPGYVFDENKTIELDRLSSIRFALGADSSIYGAWRSDFNTGGFYTFSPNGKLTRDGSRLRRPSGISLDPSGNIWIVVEEDEIRKFSRLGVNDAGATVTLDSSNANPSGLAIDSSGNFWVLDSTDVSIYKYSSSGVFDSTATVTLSNSTGFYEGLTIDSNGNFLALENRSGSVHTYSPNGTLNQDATLDVSSLDRSTPSGLDFDSSEDLWIMGFFGQRLYKFRRRGTIQEQVTSLTIFGTKRFIPDGIIPTGINQIVVPGTISSEQSVVGDSTLTVNASTVNDGPYCTMGTGDDAGKLVFSRNGILRIGIGITCRIGAANGRCSPGINITGTGVQVLGRTNGYYRATNVNKQIFRSLDLLVTKDAVGTIQIINPNEAFSNATLLVSALSHIVIFAYGGTAGRDGRDGTPLTIPNLLNAIGGSPTDEQVLTYESTGTTLKWATPAANITPVPYVTGDPHYWVSSNDARTLTLIIHDVDITNTNRTTDQLLVTIQGEPFTLSWPIATASRRINIALNSTQATNINDNASGSVPISVALRRGTTTLQLIQIVNLPVIVPGKALALKEDVGTFAVVATDSTVTPPRITQFSVNGVTYQV